MIGKPLEGRTAVVTGAGKGIGMGIAQHLAAAGAAVVIDYSFSEAGAIKVRDGIIAEGGKAMIFKADVSKEEEVVALMKAAVDWTGRLDILVNNAALQANVTFPDYKMETYDSLINVNLGGYFMCIREAAKYMIPEKRGFILCVSSVHAKRPTEFDPTYCMTKGGIKMLEREAAVELAPHNIRVVCVEPGGVRLEAPKSGNEGEIVSRKLYEQERLFPYKRYSPIAGRGMYPSDVGQMAVLLATDDCELITGTEVGMDRGDMLY